MPANEETPVGRLKKVYELATMRVEPGQEVPPMPPQFREWAQSTSIATFLGICIQGTRAYGQLNQLGPYQPQQPGLSKAQEARLIAEENTRRLGRLSRQAIKGGLYFGGLTGLFYAVSLTSTVARGEKSLYDSVLGATLTGATAGVFLASSAPARLKSFGLGGLLGASVGFPVGLLQQFVDEKSGRSSKHAADIDPLVAEDSKYPQLGKDPAKAVIDRLESTLK